MAARAQRGGPRPTWRPWRIIKSDDKKRARINAIRYFLSHFDYPGKREELLALDRRIVRTVQEELGVED